MEAKEKAKMLFDRYYKLNEATDACFGFCDKEPISVCDHTGHGCGLWKTYAKSFALIAVDEILNALPKLVAADGYGSARFNNPNVDFYQAVKEEIEKL